MSLQVEFDFVLPKGFVDDEGKVHKEGTMRLATARDEIAPLRDPRVRANEAYLVVILLSQVITRLGTLSRVSPAVIERMFAADIAFLQDLYRQINDPQPHYVPAVCPNCGEEHEVEVGLLGE
jgi:hypothetical protein